MKSPSGEESFHSLVQLLRRIAFLLLECGTKRRRGEGTRGEASWPGAGLEVEGNQGKDRLRLLSCRLGTNASMA